MKQPKVKTSRKKYCKPRLRIIELTADEVLATGCKTNGGRVWPGIPNCGILNSCVTSGS